MQDIDNLIDWQQFYSQYVHDAKRCGENKMNACCPFHHEEHPSFWFNTQNGMFKCEGCGASGNATKFLADIKGIDTKEAYKELCRIAGVDSPAKRTKKQPVVMPYTLDNYSEEKCLEVEWLKREFGMSEGKDKLGQFVTIPYITEDGEVLGTKKRYHPLASTRFTWAKGSKLCLYGLGKLTNTEQVILVEGESDTQTLYMLGFNALGVPGSTTFQADWVKDICNVKNLYIHIEPDDGGQHFRQNTIRRLAEANFQGNVYTFTLGGLAKDPSALYINDGAGAADEIRNAIAGAERINLAEDSLPELIPHMPVRLACPNGWQMSSDGIKAYNARAESWNLVLKTPIIIVNRLRNHESNEQKVRVAFFRNGHWIYAVVAPTVIYQSKNIVQLADLGALITSENAKQVVQFLSDLESENMDRISEIRCVSQLGWIEHKFMPYAADNILLDADPSLQSRIEAYVPSGSLSDWLQHMDPFRCNVRFRFLLAAAFAPPLLRILNQRIFFVYNWGDSESGKTAALHAALSAWGDPERLVVNFNATKVGLEQTAAFYKDLPIGLNERQLAGNKQENVDQIVYMISEGQSKVRGTKSGGLQTQRTWRSIILATGEEPITSDSSQTGVSTRVIEVYGGPIDNKRDAAEMYPFTATSHGTAGAAYIQRLIGAGDAYVKEIYQKVYKRISEASDDVDGSHISGIATVSTADVLFSMWMYGRSEETAIQISSSMGITVLSMQQATKERNVNNKALQSIMDWIMSNQKQFDDPANGQEFGFMSTNDNMCFAFPTAIRNYLTSQGYSYRKTMRFLAENKIVETDPAGKYSIVAYNRRARCNTRYVKIDLQAAGELLGNNNTFAELPAESTPFDKGGEEDG